MAITNPNHPSGIRKYIDDQIDDVISYVDTAQSGDTTAFTKQKAADRVDTPAAAVQAALFRGYSTVVQLVGDSTGNESTEWFALLGQKLGTDFSNFNVLYRPWNASTQFYDMPTVLQAGPNGQSGLVFASGAMRYSGSNLASSASDLDVRLRLKPTSWASGGLQVPFSKWEQTTGNQRGWWFGITSTGLLCLTWTTDGNSGTQVQKFSSVSTGFSANTERWVRATLDVNNGSTQNEVKFYTSTDGVTWSQLGTTQTTAGVTSVHASTASYQLGALDSTLGSTYAGEISWAEAREGIDGYSLVPPLPGTWDQASNWLANTITHTGSPTLLLVNGSEGGQNMAYWDNATRRPKVMAPHRQDLIILSTGHNETQFTTQTFITAYSTWITNIKALLPNVPIVAVTQNPQKSPRVQTSIDVHAKRGIVLMGLCRSLVGVYGVDTFRAFTDVTNQVSSDGVHPTTAGSQVWRDYVYNSLFPTS